MAGRCSAMTSRRLVIPTLLFVVMLAMLVALGTWQVQRLHWKTALLADIEQRLLAEPLDIAQWDGQRALHFQRVHLTGRFIGPAVTMPAKVYDSVVGAHIVQLFATVPERGIFIVNRGWVANDQLSAVLAQMQSAPTAPLTISGLLRLPSAAGVFTPPNDLARRIFYSYQPADFAQIANMPAPAVQPYVLELDADLNGELPIKSGMFVPTLPNKHLGYALTWYGLAIVLCIIYGVYFRQARKRTEE